MKIIGLTGQTGAGKGTVAKKLTEYGCVHLDADLIAKNIISASEVVLSNLKQEFGNDIFNSNNELDRKALAKKAFSSFKNTEKLNQITHPAVTKAIRKIIDAEREKGTKAVIIDAIALFESGEDKLCDFCIAVVAPEEIRLKRIMQRDNISEVMALIRINAQKEEKFYTAKADFVVRNYLPFDIDDEMRPIIEKIS